ncbi:MAG: YgjV family protein [Oscillospiraceae bacterium]|nr:YgjV family protein [Oscillospiraceae bacterium]
MSFDITILGHIFSGIACIIMVAIGFLKKKEQVVLGQCFQLGFLGAGNLVFGAYSGSIGNFLGVIRNLILPKSKKPLVWKIVFIAVQLALSLAFYKSTIADADPATVAGLKLIYWIPLLYTIVLTAVLDTKNVNVFRVAIMIAQSIFCFFDGFYGNWFAFAANILTVLTNGYSIIADARAAKKAKA